MTAELVSDRIFGGTQSPVEIKNAMFDPDRGVLVLDISGPDVPECAEVTAQITLQQNRVGERLHTIVFKPVE